MGRSIARAGFGSLGGFELGDFLRNAFVKSSFELGTIAEVEENLKPNEERGQKESLDKVVEQSRRTSFEDTMSNELSEPCANVNCEGIVVGSHAISGSKVVGKCGGSEQKWRQ